MGDRYPQPHTGSHMPHARHTHPSHMPHACLTHASHMHLNGQHARQRAGVRNLINAVQHVATYYTMLQRSTPCSRMASSAAKPRRATTCGLVCGADRRPDWMGRTARCRYRVPSAPHACASQVALQRDTLHSLAPYCTSAACCRLPRQEYRRVKLLLRSSPLADDLAAMQACAPPFRWADRGGTGPTGVALGR